MRVRFHPLPRRWASARTRSAREDRCARANSSESAARSAITAANTRSRAWSTAPHSRCAVSSPSGSLERGRPLSAPSVGLTPQQNPQIKSFFGQKISSNHGFGLDRRWFRSDELARVVRDPYIWTEVWAYCVPVAGVISVEESRSVDLHGAARAVCRPSRSLSKLIVRK